MFAPRRRTCSRREATMREWRVRRALQPQPDGQRCWDRAYQQLLTWTQVQNASAAATVMLDPPRRRSKMRIALYARVSTQRQAQADGVSQQLQRLRAHALGQGWIVAEENVFRDDGYSGASLKRPGLERLRDRAALRDLDRVLITAPDRLARQLRPPGAADRGDHGHGVPGRVPRPPDEPGPARPACCCRSAARSLNTSGA